MIKKVPGIIFKVVFFQIILIGKIFSQSLAPDFIWGNNFGGTGNDGSFDVVVDNSGDIIATGSFQNTISFGNFQLTASSQSFDIFLVKFDTDGNVIWAKSGGGIDNDRVYGVSVDNSDNIVITGTFSGRAVFDTSSVTAGANSDVFIAKYSPDGEVLWVRNFDALNGYDYGYDITTDNLDNILVTGTSQNFGAVTLPCFIFVLKYNPQGILQWGISANGPNLNNSGYGIATNSSNEVFVVGCAADSVDFSGTVFMADPGGDIFLAKYSADGNFNWVRQAGFNNNNDQGGAITIDGNDEIFITGHFRDIALFGSNTELIPVGNSDIFLAGYDQSGNLLWVKQDSLQNDTYGTGITLDSAGNISVIGSHFVAPTESNSILVERFSADGKLLWNKLIAAPPSYGFPGGISKDPDGNVVISGYYLNQQTQTEDILVGKLPSPLMIPDKNPFDMGTAETGDSLTGTLIISNPGRANLFILSSMLIGPDADNFSLQNNLPQIIPPLQSANINIGFIPKTPGLKTGYLVIRSDAQSSPDTIVITGTGNIPSLTISDDSLNFGNIAISDSSDLRLTISNLSSADIIINDYQTTSSEFQLLDFFAPDTLSPGDSRILLVRFKPSNPGLSTGYLLISGSETDSVFLSGSGLIPSLAFSSDILDFGIVDVSNFSDLTLTLINQTSFDVTVDSAVFRVSDEINFSFVNPPQFPINIPGNGFANLVARFSPVASGSISDNLILYSNTAGSPDTITLTGNGVESIIVNLPDTILNDRNVIINVTSPGGNFSENQFFFRRTGESNYQSGQLLLSGNNYIGNIPPEFSTVRGIQFYIIFSDPVENISITYPTDNPVINPAYIPVNIQSLEFPVTIPAGRYRMISIPLVLSEPGFSSVLENDFGPYDNKIWRLFRWDAVSGDYSEYENIEDNFQPGNSFWLINRSNQILTIENAASVTPGSSFTISLLSGWNQVANPFTFPVLWSDIGNSDLLLQAPAGWNPDTEEYKYDQLILNPWEGYWVYNQTSGVINLNVPPVENQIIPKRNDTGIRDNYSPLVQIKSKLEFSGIHDNENYVGMIDGASDSYDRYDIIEAPPVSDDLRLSVLSGDKLYAKNIVPLSEDGACWYLKITSSRKDKKVHISLEIKNPLPENFGIWLQDTEEKYSIPLINGSAAINLNNSNEKILRLIIGSQDYAEKVSDILLVPDRYELYQNFPNPFNPLTSIYFSLKENSTVSLEIFDILGSKIKNLINNEFMNAGLHHAVWNGTDLYGKKVSAGVYIYRIKADNFSASKKMILLK